MAFDLRFTLHKVSVFCTVVETGGIGRAAEQLYVAQPVVTAHVRSLEERLGTRLFERAGRQTRLTPAGEAVYEWAREILTQAQELERELDGLGDGTTGTAAIVASMSVGSYLLPPILSQFHRERPGASVSLSVTDCEHALEDIATGAADFAVVFADRPPEPSMFEDEILGREELVLVVSPDFRRIGERATLDEVRALPFIASPHDHLRRELIDAQLRGAGLDQVRVAIELGHPEAVKRAARDGVGAAVLLRSAVRDDLAADLLRAVSIVGTHLSISLHLVQRRRKTLSPLQAQLLEFVRRHVAAELGAGPATPRLRALKTEVG